MNDQFKAQITYKAREFATAYTNRHFPNEPAFAFGNEGWAKFVDALVELAGAHPDKGTSALPFPARIMDQIQDMARREDTEHYGAWTDGDGEPLQDDADAAIAWIKSAAATSSAVAIKTSAPEIPDNSFDARLVMAERERCAKMCDLRARELEAARAHADGTLQGANQKYWGPLLDVVADLAKRIRAAAPVVPAPVAQLSEPPERKSLNAQAADLLRPFLQPGQKVIWRDSFRWKDDNGVLSNHYDSMELEALAENFGYEWTYDLNFKHAAIIEAAAAPTTPKEAE